MGIISCGMECRDQHCSTHYNKPGSETAVVLWNSCRRNRRHAAAGRAVAAASATQPEWHCRPAYPTPQACTLLVLAEARPGCPEAARRRGSRGAAVVCLAVTRALRLGDWQNRGCARGERACWPEWLCGPACHSCCAVRFRAAAPARVMVTVRSAHPAWHAARAAWARVAVTAHILAQQPRHATHRPGGKCRAGAAATVTEWEGAAP